MPKKPKATFSTLLSRSTSLLPGVGTSKGIDSGILYILCSASRATGSTTMDYLCPLYENEFTTEGTIGSH